MPGDPVMDAFDLADGVAGRAGADPVSEAFDLADADAAYKPAGTLAGWQPDDREAAARGLGGMPQEMDPGALAWAPNADPGAFARRPTPGLGSPDALRGLDRTPSQPIHQLAVGAARGAFSGIPAQAGMVLESGAVAEANPIKAALHGAAAMFDMQSGGTGMAGPFLRNVAGNMPMAPLGPLGSQVADIGRTMQGIGNAVGTAIDAAVPARSGIDQAFRSVGESLPQMAGSAALATAAAPIGGPVLSIFASMGANLPLQFAQDIDQSVQGIMANNPGMTREEAITRAVMPAATTAVMSSAIEGGFGPETQAGRVIIRKAGENLAGEVTRRLMAGVGKSALEEFVTEPVQGTISDVGQAAAGGLTPELASGFAERRANDAIVGGLGGLLIGGGMQAGQEAGSIIARRAAGIPFGGAATNPAQQPNQAQQTGQQQKPQDAGDGSQAGKGRFAPGDSVLDELGITREQAAGVMASDDPRAALAELMARKGGPVEPDTIGESKPSEPHQPGKVAAAYSDAMGSNRRVKINTPASRLQDLLGPPDSAVRQSEEARKQAEFDRAREEERQNYLRMAGEQDTAQANADFLADNQGVDQPGSVSGTQADIPEQGLEARMRSMPLDDLRALSERLTGFRTGARPALMMRVRRAVAEGATVNGRRDTANQGGERSPGQWPELYQNQTPQRPGMSAAPTPNKEPTNGVQTQEGQEGRPGLLKPADATTETPAPAAGGSVDPATVTQELLAPDVRAKLKPNTAVMQVRDRDGNHVGYVEEAYDGSMNGLGEAARKLNNRASMEFGEDFSGVQSRTLASFSGDTFVVSPNGMDAAPVGSDEAKYIAGDLSKAPKSRPRAGGATPPTRARTDETSRPPSTSRSTTEPASSTTPRLPSRQEASATQSDRGSESGVARPSGNGTPSSRIGPTTDKAVPASEAKPQLPANDDSGKTDSSAKAAPVKESLTTGAKESLLDAMGQKHFWAMTRAEIARDGAERLKSLRGQRAEVNKLTGSKGYANWRIKSSSKDLKDAIENQQRSTQRLLDVHKERVQEALAAGKPVPPEVLADYPELSKSASRTTAENTPKWGVYGPVKVKDRGEMYVVRESDHANGFGDTMHASREEAEKYAAEAKDRAEKNAAYRAKEDAAQAEKDAAEKAKQAERDDVDGFGDDLPPMVKGRKIADLNKMVGVDGKPGTVKQHVREMVARGATLATREENKVKEWTRTQYNRADQRQQDEHARKVREGGKITVYTIDGYDFGKTAYDYAKHLQARKSTAPPVAPQPEPSPRPAPRSDSSERGGEVSREQIQPTTANFIRLRGGSIIEDAKGTQYRVESVRDVSNMKDQFGRGPEDHFLIGAFKRTPRVGWSDSKTILSTNEQPLYFVPEKSAREQQAEQAFGAPPDYKAMSIPDLRAAAKARGLPHTGMVSKIRKALEEADRSVLKPSEPVVDPRDGAANPLNKPVQRPQDAKKDVPQQGQQAPDQKEQKGQPDRDGGENVEHAKTVGTLSNLSAEDQARAAELKRKIAAKLRNELRSGFDPEMFAAGVELTALYVKAGIKRFNVFARQMIADLGDGIKPYLKSFYNGARSFPGVDASQMDAAADVEAMDVEKAVVEETVKPSSPWAERTRESTVWYQTQDQPLADKIEEWLRGGALPTRVRGDWNGRPIRANESERVLTKQTQQVADQTGRVARLVQHVKTRMFFIVDVPVADLDSNGYPIEADTPLKNNDNYELVKIAKPSKPSTTRIDNLHSQIAVAGRTSGATVNEKAEKPGSSKANAIQRFKVGDRVKDQFGKILTITGITTDATRNERLHDSEMGQVFDGGEFSPNPYYRKYEVRVPLDAYTKNPNGTATDDGLELAGEESKPEPKAADSPVTVADSETTEYTDGSKATRYTLSNGDAIVTGDSGVFQVQRRSGPGVILGGVFPSLNAALDSINGRAVTPAKETEAPAATPETKDGVTTIGKYRIHHRADEGWSVNYTMDNASHGRRGIPTREEAVALAEKWHAKDVESEKSHRDSYPMTLGGWPAVRDAIDKGTMSAADLLDRYRWFVRSESKLKEELGQRTLKQLAPAGTGGRTKPQIIDAIYDRMLSRFNLGRSVQYQPFGGETYQGALAKSIESITDEDIKKYREERENAIATNKKAMENPETFEEFRTFINAKGEDALSLDQRKRYDAIVAAKEAEGQARPDRIAKVETGDVKLEYKEGFHEKQGIPLHIVQLTGGRVSSEAFSSLRIAAKKLGGWWSSFKKDSTGFQFKTKEAADEFVKINQQGISTEATDKLREEDQAKRSAERLAALAEGKAENAQDVLDRDRKTNTARRARMAEGAEADARKEQQKAETLANIAKAIEDNTLTSHLRKVRTATQVDELERSLMLAQREYFYSLPEESRRSVQRDSKWWEIPIDENVVAKVTMPMPEPHIGHVRTLAEEAAKTNGYKREAVKLTRLWKAATAKDAQANTVKIDNPYDFNTLKSVTARFRASAGHRLWAADAVNDQLMHHERMVNMGITSSAALRTALREYLPLRAGKRMADPIVEMERGLIGKTVGIDFFPTPKDVANRMVEMADIQPGMRVLEPSAGNGRIADAIKAAGVDPDVVELSSSLRPILEAKGHKLVGADFTDFEPEQKYDRIVMNPPFGSGLQGLDGEHVQRAYDMLAPGGRVVAIMSEGPFSRTDKKSVAFRGWLNRVGGVSEPMDEGTFESDQQGLPTTGVRTRIVTIDKPGEAAFSARAMDDDVRDSILRQAAKPISEGGSGPGTPTSTQEQDEAKPVYRDEIQELSTLLRKQVGKEMSVNRRWIAAEGVMRDTSPVVKKALASVLWDIAPQVAEYGTKYISFKQALEETRPADPKVEETATESDADRMRANAATFVPWRTMKGTIKGGFDLISSADSSPFITDGRSLIKKEYLRPKAAAKMQELDRNERTTVDEKTMAKVWDDTTVQAMHTPATLVGVVRAKTDPKYEPSLLAVLDAGKRFVYLSAERLKALELVLDFDGFKTTGSDQKPGGVVLTKGATDVAIIMPVGPKRQVLTREDLEAAKAGKLEDPAAPQPAPVEDISTPDPVDPAKVFIVEPALPESNKKALTETAEKFQKAYLREHGVYIKLQGEFDDLQKQLAGRPEIKKQIDEAKKAITGAGMRDRRAQKERSILYDAAKADPAGKKLYDAIDAQIRRKEAIGEQRDSAAAEARGEDAKIAAAAEEGRKQASADFMKALSGTPWWKIQSQVKKYKEMSDAEFATHYESIVGKAPSPNFGREEHIKAMENVAGEPSGSMDDIENIRPGERLPAGWKYKGPSQAISYGPSFFKEPHAEAMGVNPSALVQRNKDRGGTTYTLTFPDPETANTGDDAPFNFNGNGDLPGLKALLRVADTVDEFSLDPVLNLTDKGWTWTSGPQTFSFALTSNPSMPIGSTMFVDVEALRNNLKIQTPRRLVQYAEGTPGWTAEQAREKSAEFGSMDAKREKVFRRLRRLSIPDLRALAAEKGIPSTGAIGIVRRRLENNLLAEEDAKTIQTDMRVETGNFDISVQPVEPADGIESDLAAFLSRMGQTPVFLQIEGAGAAIEGTAMGRSRDRVYVMAGMGERAATVALHELMHALRVQNPDLYRPLVRTVGEQRIKDEAARYRADLARNFGEGSEWVKGYDADAEHQEDEGLARAVESMADDPEVRAAMLERPGLWKRLRRWVASQLHKFGFGSEKDRLRVAVLGVLDGLEQGRIRYESGMGPDATISAVGTTGPGARMNIEGERLIDNERLMAEQRKVDEENRAEHEKWMAEDKADHRMSRYHQLVMAQTNRKERVINEIRKHIGVRGGAVESNGRRYVISMNTFPGALPWRVTNYDQNNAGKWRPYGHTEHSRLDSPGSRLGAVQEVASRIAEPGSVSRAVFSVAPPTESAAFKAWFKDSKVVDASGKPLVVYHGSPDVRGVFAEGFKARSRGQVWFAAADRSVADSYADDRRAFDYQNAEPQTIPLYLAITNPMVVDAKGKHWRDTERHVQEAKDAGHDGIIIKNSVDYYLSEQGKTGKPTTVYAWFTPTQAKSAVSEQLRSRVDGKPIEGATGNRGTFDPANPDIRMSVKRGDKPKPDAPVNIRSAAAVATLAASRALDAKVSKGKKLTDIIRAILADKTFTKIPDSVKTEEGIKKVQRLARAILADAGPDGKNWAAALATVEAEYKRLGEIKTDAAVAKRFKAKDAESLSAKLGDAQKRAGAMSAVEQRAFEESRTEANKRVSNTERVMRQEMGRQYREVMRDTQAWLADAERSIWKARRDERKMGKFETRSAAEGAKANEQAKQRVADGIRAELVRLIEENMPRSIRGKYLVAVKNTASPAALVGVMGRMRRDLVRHDARFHILRARAAMQPGIAFLEPAVQTDVRAAIAAIARARAVLWPKKTRTPGAKPARVPVEALSLAREEIRDAANLIVSAFHEQKTLDTIRIGAEAVDAATKRAQIIAAQKDRPELEGRGSQGNREADGLTRMMRRRTNWEQLSRLIDGFKPGGAAMQLFHDVLRGRRLATAMHQKFSDAFGAIVQANGYANLGKFLAEVSGTLGPEGQKTVDVQFGPHKRLTLGQALYIYASSKDEGFRARVLPKIDANGMVKSAGQTVQFKDADNEQPFNIDDSDLARVSKAIPSNLKAIVDQGKAEYDATFFEQLSRVNKRLKGYFLEKVPGYWGIKLIRKAGPDRGTPSNWKGAAIRALEAAGFMQERTGASKAPISIGDFGTDIITRARAAAHTIHKAERVKAMVRVLLHADPAHADQNVVAAITKTLGAETIQRLETRIAAWSEGDSGIQADKGFRRLLSLWARSKTQLWVPTWIRNATGAAKLLNDHSVAGFLSGISGITPGAYADLRKHSPELRERWDGGGLGAFQTDAATHVGHAGIVDAAKMTLRNLVTAARGVEARRGASRGDLVKGSGRAWNSMLDAVTVGNYFDAIPALIAYRAFLKRAPHTLDAEGKKAWAARHATRSFERISNTSNTEYGNDIQLKARDSVMLASLIPFTGDTAKTQTMLYEAWSKGPKKVIATTAVLAFASTLSALTSALVSGARGDDEDKMAQAANVRFWSELSSVIPGGGVAAQLYRAITSDYQSASVLDTAFVDVLDQAVQVVKDAVSAYARADKPTKRRMLTAADLRSRAIWRAVDLGGDLVGLPIGQYRQFVNKAIDQWTK